MKLNSQQSKVILRSSDNNLIESFDWAKEQALDYVNIGDPVGDWYEATLPGRKSFCMRDTAHQSNGAQVLGLGFCNRNMLRRFAENISAAKDWCTYWEIDRFNMPYKGDYRDDTHFWYNLPANFDLMHACYRQYLWTGDRMYLDDPALRFFYLHSVYSYVGFWDKDGDGLVDHLPEYKTRGIASYNEDKRNKHILVAGDMVAAQYAGYITYANVMEQEGNNSEANEFSGRAEKLKNLYDNTWWNNDTGHYYSGMRQDRSFSSSYIGIANFLPLYFGIIEAGKKTELTLDYIIENGAVNIEEKSYLPEIFYRFGRNDAAYTTLLEISDPALKRREYPEISYAVIGSMATGLMGISPDARERLIGTLSGVTMQTEWVTMENIPVFGNEIKVAHSGKNKTMFTNQSGPPLFWKASFEGDTKELFVDGYKYSALHEIGTGGNKESFVIIRVDRGKSHTVEIS
tara:strand:- start:3630 stop:5003 length:1374 start_codon:yes stop_codon:yes gene_type:complete